MDLGKLLTEQRNDASRQIDTVSTVEMLGIINREDQKVAHVSVSLGWNSLEKTSMPTAVSEKMVADKLTEYWSPRVIAEVDQFYVKVAGDRHEH